MSEYARLYYTDSYLTEFEARCKAFTDYEGRPAMILDKTCFYPTGGGQPHDIGTLNGLPVVEVITRAEDDEILHLVDKIPESLAVGDVVRGKIDWQRRFDLMQQHTGQHILSRAFIEIADADTVGFHLTEDNLTIDLNKATTDLDAVENLANQMIAENRAVKAWFPSDEELAELALRKLSEKVTDAAHIAVRVVDIDGFDVCACGGTHVRQTGAIGMIKIVRTENLKKGMRIEFRCGQRALEDYREKNNLLLNLAGELTTGYQDVPDSVLRLREDNKALVKELKSAKGRLLKYEAEDIWQAAHDENPDSKRVIIVRLWEDREVSDLQTLMRHLTEKPQTIALFARSGETGHLIFGSSQDAKFDVVPLLKACLETLGTQRGGGRPTLAQGGGFKVSKAQLESVLDYAEKRAKSS